MASITISNFDDGLKQRLGIRAAKNGRSVEAEVRHILHTALQEDVRHSPRTTSQRQYPSRNLAAAIRTHIAPLGGVNLNLPPREPMPKPVRFD